MPFKAGQNKVKKVAPNQSEKSKSTEIAVKAYRDEENKSILLKQDLQRESNRLISMLNLLQQHQAKLKGNDDENRSDPTGTTKWYGPLLPPPESITSLCHLLNKELEVTEHFTGCHIEECDSVFLSDSNGELKRQFDAEGKVNRIEFDLQLESVFQVMTGKHHVSRVDNVVFRPHRPELLPLQQYLQQTNNIYLLPRALHTVQDIEQDQLRVRGWSTQQRLEVVSSPLRLVLCYMPFMTQQQQTSVKRSGQRKARGAVKVKKERKEKAASPHSDELSSDAPHSEISSTESEPSVVDIHSGNDADDDTDEEMLVKLNWTIRFCEHRKNFISSFGLVVSDGVLARYSQSPIHPLLAKKTPILAGDDVMELFTGLSH